MAKNKNKGKAHIAVLILLLIAAFGAVFAEEEITSSGSSTNSTVNLGEYAEKNASIKSYSSKWQWVLVYPTEDLAADQLNSWYKAFLDEKTVNCAVIVGNTRDEKLTGIYATPQKLYKGIKLTKSENGTYAAEMTSAKETFEAGENGLNLSAMKSADAATSVSAEADSSDEKACKTVHVPESTKVVHHDAQTHEEPVYGSTGSDKSYVCDACGQTFPSYDVWLAHIRESHGDQGSYHLVGNGAGTKTVIDVPAWDETVKVPVHDEKACN